MLRLERVHAKNTAGEYIRNEKGEAITLPYVNVTRASKRMHFSPRFLRNGIKDGWLSVRDGHIQLHRPPPADAVVYKIVSHPKDFLRDGEVQNYYICERVA
jgi:hypothetical protein